MTMALAQDMGRSCSRMGAAAVTCMDHDPFRRWFPLDGRDAESERDARWAMPTGPRDCSPPR